MKYHMISECGHETEGITARPLMICQGSLVIEVDSGLPSLPVMRSNIGGAASVIQNLKACSGWVLAE